MSIIEDYIELFRTLRTSRYIDTANIIRLTDRGTLDPVTLQYDGAPTVVYADLGVLVRPMGRRQQVEEFGEETVTYFDHSVFAPWDTTDVRVDDRVVVTASGHDPDLVGAVLIVRALPVDSYRTTLHIWAERDLGPGQEV